MEISYSRSLSASMKLGVSVIARKQANVQKLNFSEQKRNLMKQKIKLDEDEKMQRIETDRKGAVLKSSLAQLEQEKELAAAEAEVGAHKTAERESGRGDGG